MRVEIIVWLLIFAVSAVIFLGIAAVVTVQGFLDVKMLLKESDVGEDIHQDAEAPDR